ncbi:ABC transporter substrate-binding protein [Pectobacteriaceae bacterium CE90]|nr:ABC transporter substrate-binding protein [Pectobacteriaceae bacterium CE90]
MLKKTVISSLFGLLMATSVHAQEKVTVLLDWFINADHASLFVADQIGAFKAEGLDVEFVPPADPSTPSRLVAAKQGDIAISYQPQLYMYADQGLPLVRVGTIINTPLNTLAVLASSGIHSMADLKGKKIGYSVSGIEEATLNSMLKQGKLTLKDVTLINVNFQLVSALMSKNVDAVLGGFRNIEAPEIRELGVEPILFNVEDYGVPAYDELIVLVNKDSVGDPKIKKFMIALKKGTEYLRMHPQETWAVFAKLHPDLNNKLNKIAWMATLPYFAKDPMKLDVERYRNYGHFLFENKLINKELPVSDYAVELK